MARHRLRFEKTGRAKWLSHLDLMRTIQRVFPRAGVQIRHTEGFNPHAYISVALPLSVGMESYCELLDFELTDNTPHGSLPELLTSKLPEGIRVLEAYEATQKLKELSWLRIAGALEYDALQNTADMAGKLNEFFKKPSLMVTKRTKRKEEAQIDLIPMIKELTFTEQTPHKVAVTAVVAAQNPSLNPAMLLAALKQHVPELSPDFAAFTRLEVYDKDMKVFR